MAEELKQRFQQNATLADDEINLIDLAITVAKHKKLILGAPLIAAVVAAVYSLFLPNIYTADTVILPPQPQSSASAMLLQLGALSNMAGMSGGLKNPNDTYVSMLKSRTIQDNIIKRFNLQTVYKTTSPADLRGVLSAATNISVGKDGIIVISVEDQNPKRAALLANGYVDELQRLTQVFAVTEASQRRLFFEKQLLQAKKNLSDAEVSLKLLQEQTGIIQLDSQSQQVIGTAAALKAQIAMKEVELGAMRTFATGNNPDYIRAEQMLAGLRAQLSKIEIGSVTTGRVPETGLEYLRKVRDLKYAETIYELLSKQFEMAKIDEAKETSLIQVLDKAVIPEQRTKPARSRIVLLVTLAMVVLSIIWSFIYEAYHSIIKDNENAVRLNLLKNYLRFK